MSFVGGGVALHHLVEGGLELAQLLDEVRVLLGKFRERVHFPVPKMRNPIPS